MPASPLPFELLSPLLLTCLTAALLCTGRLVKSPSALSLGFAFLCLGCGITIQVLFQPSQDPISLLYVSGFTACYLGACAWAAHTVAQRMQVQMPWRLAAALAAITWLLQAWYTLANPDLASRVYVLKLMCALILSLPLWQWPRMQPHNRFDRILRAAYVCFLVSDIAHVLLQLPTSAHVDTSAFTKTWYWMGTHIFAIAFGVVLAMLLLLAISQDVLERMNQERRQDPLTRLLNRRGFYELSQLQKNQRGRVHWAVLMVDLDHFKRINDSYGHAQGDQVLKTIAALVQQHVRSSDLAARFGGEEFVLLCANLTPADAHTLAERIRSCIAQHHFDGLPPHQQITASMGLAWLPQLTDASLTWGISMADAALYQAKHEGRNRVIMSEEKFPSPNSMSMTEPNVCAG